MRVLMLFAAAAPPVGQPAIAGRSVRPDSSSCSQRGVLLPGLHGVGAVVAWAAVHVALVLVVVVVAAVVLRLLGHALAAAAEQVAVGLLQQGQVQQPAAR